MKVIEVSRGRALGVCLSGRRGDLQLVNVYGHTGDRSTASRGRSELWRRAAGHLLPARDSAAFLSGDFNVTWGEGQSSSLGRQGQGVGRPVSTHVAQAFTYLLGKASLYPVEQDLHTYRHGGGRASSNLDRLYTSVHPGYLQDRDLHCGVLGTWGADPGGSYHLPVSWGVSEVLWCMNE